MNLPRWYNGTPEGIKANKRGNLTVTDRSAKITPFCGMIIEAGHGILMITCDAFNTAPVGGSCEHLEGLWHLGEDGQAKRNMEDSDVGTSTSLENWTNG